MEESIAANLAAVRGRIEAAARAAGRPPEAVSLVAVSKTQPADAVRAALAPDPLPLRLVFPKTVA